MVLEKRLGFRRGGELGPTGLHGGAELAQLFRRPVIEIDALCTENLRGSGRS